MAREFTTNWACSAVRDAMRRGNPSAAQIADYLAKQPAFHRAIQDVLDNPSPRGVPGGDPAEQMVSNISEAQRSSLVKPCLLGTLCSDTTLQDEFSD